MYDNPTIMDILLISFIGFVTVFIVLIVLMAIIVLISRVFGEKKKPEKVPSAVVKTQPENESEADTYTGVKLSGVSDKEAALLMAIVADNLKKPLNNLRFISIKEKK